MSHLTLIVGLIVNLINETHYYVKVKTISPGIPNTYPVRRKCSIK